MEGIIIVAIFAALFIWGAFIPLPEDRALPKKERPRTIGQAYFDTLKQS